MQHFHVCNWPEWWLKKYSTVCTQTTVACGSIYTAKHVIFRFRAEISKEIFLKIPSNLSVGLSTSYKNYNNIPDLHTYSNLHTNVKFTLFPFLNPWSWILHFKKIRVKITRWRQCSYITVFRVTWEKKHEWGPRWHAFTVETVMYEP